MKRSTARRTERKARRDEKRAAINPTETTIPDPEGDRPWTVRPGACPVRWEDAPEPEQPGRGPRVVGQMAWRD